MCCRRQQRTAYSTFSSDLGENLNSKKRKQLNLTYIHKNVCVSEARHTNREKLWIFFFNILYWIGSPLLNMQKWTLKRSWGCDVLSTWMQRPISPCRLSPRTACLIFSWSWLVFCSLCSGIFRAARLPMQPVLLSVFSGARSTQLLIIFCQTSDLFAAVFPLQHHIAIPLSSVSKELYNYNTNV